jgi:hypothetical protein
VPKFVKFIIVRLSLTCTTRDHQPMPGRQKRPYTEGLPVSDPAQGLLKLEEIAAGEQSATSSFIQQQ